MFARLGAAVRRWVARQTDEDLGWWAVLAVVESAVWAAVALAEMRDGAREGRRR